MNKKSVEIFNLKDKNNDLLYWLSKPVWKRIEAVEILRKQFNGRTKRFQRIIRITQQT